jgi:hypothetical protein
MPCSMVTSPHPTHSERPEQTPTATQKGDVHVDVDAIEREMAALSAHIESAKYRLLELIYAFDKAEAWGERGFVSCAAFLGYRIGLGKVAAREHVGSGGSPARAAGPTPG